MAGHLLVTGAGGLIGRAVIEALPTSLEVSALRSTDVDLLAPGVFAELVHDTVPAAVLHLAWIASGSPGYRTSPDNIRWRAVTRQAASAAIEAGVRFIATGSAIDDSPGTDPYTAAKAGLRSDLSDAIRDGRITWARPHYVFDPEAPSPAVLRAALDARQRGVAVRLREPYALHDFVHVGDVARALVAVVDNRLTGVVDIGLGELTAVHALVERLGASWSETYGVTTNAGTDSVADVGPLARVGWHPTETERFLS